MLSDKTTLRVATERLFQASRTGSRLVPLSELVSKEDFALANLKDVPGYDLHELKVYQIPPADEQKMALLRAKLAAGLVNRGLPFTFAQAARTLRIRFRTLKRLARQGLLPTVAVGGRRVIQQADLLKLQRLAFGGGWHAIDHWAAGRMGSTNTMEAGSLPGRQ